MLWRWHPRAPASHGGDLRERLAPHAGSRQSLRPPGHRRGPPLRQRCPRRGARHEHRTPATGPDGNAPSRSGGLEAGGAGGPPDLRAHHRRPRRAVPRRLRAHRSPPRSHTSGARGVRGQLGGLHGGLRLLPRAGAGRFLERLPAMGGPDSTGEGRRLGLAPIAPAPFAHSCEERDRRRAPEDAPRLPRARLHLRQGGRLPDRPRSPGHAHHGRHRPPRAGRRPGRLPPGRDPCARVGASPERGPGRA